MGTNQNRRRKGQGGLYRIQKMAWDEVSQSYKLTDFYQATKEVEDPDNPGKRKKVYGTAQSAEQAISRLNRNFERYLTKKGMQSAGFQFKAPQTGSQSVSMYLEQWHSEIRASDVSPKMRYKYWGHIKNHISPHVGKIKLEALTYQDLQKLFYETLPEKKRVRGEGAGVELLLGPNGLLNIYKTLNAALKVAVKKGKIPNNPLELVKAPKYQAPRENIPQLMHIVQHMFKKMNEEQDPLFDHFLISLMGLRKGERLGLTFSDLRLTGPNPKLTISKQLAREVGIGLILKQATKSGKERTVTLQEPWLSSLKRLQDRRKEQLKLESFKPTDQFKDLVFLNDDGNPFDLNKDSEMWAAANKKYNSKQTPIRGHALRHIAATMMADTEVDREVAMSILGHESEAMSYYYGRISAKRQSGQVEKYGEALSRSIF